MAKYDYSCENCRVLLEVDTGRPMREGPPAAQFCPECDQKMQREYEAPEVIFKGGGWPGEEVRRGENYRERSEEVERFEEEVYQRGVAQEEADEIMKHRRQGKEKSKEHQSRHPKMWARYRKNMKNGFVKKDSQTFQVSKK